MKKKNEKGFSAVELLVTLFIALLFLSMGYTLYGYIVSSSSVARHRGIADTIAHEYLRKYEATASNPCAASTPLSNAAVSSDSADNLANPKVSVVISCSNTTISLMSLVKVTITYTEQGVTRSVYHEVYAAKV